MTTTVESETADALRDALADAFGRGTAGDVVERRVAKEDQQAIIRTARLLVGSSAGVAALIRDAERQWREGR